MGWLMERQDANPARALLPSARLGAPVARTEAA